MNNRFSEQMSDKPAAAVAHTMAATGQGRRIQAIAALLCTVLSAIYLYQERYFLRFVPLPASLAGLAYGGGTLLPAATPTEFSVTGSPSATRLAGEANLRQVLDDIQNLSPFAANVGAQPSFADAAEWLAYVRKTPLLCTDGTLLFRLVAARQGVPVREWQLLDRGWAPGQGHSLAEFQDPDSGRWILVDAQHGAVFRDGSGQALDMAGVLSRYNGGRHGDIVVDYGPWRSIMLAGGRGTVTEDYLFAQRLLDQPVLQLRVPTFAGRSQSNPFVIGYAIYGAESQHDPRVLLTKAALGLLMASLVAAALAARRGR